MSPALNASLAAALGHEVVELTAVAGGDVNQAYRCRLASGETVFVKSHPRAEPGMFVREAQGLAWLAQAGARVPEVLASSDQPPRWLALGWVQGGRRAADFDAQLGEMLARLHAAQVDGFGLEYDNFIGPLPQPNAPTADWASFYADRRLRPMAKRAHAAGGLRQADLATVERLCERLPERVGPPERPSRLHGDLWSGNVMTDSSGSPVLIDPACYAGHREMDLAMLSLFGHVSQRLLDAYDTVYPRSAGFEERVELHQLYPLLVHAALFGGGYGSRAAQVARRYLD